MGVTDSTFYAKADVAQIRNCVSVVLIMFALMTGHSLAHACCTQLLVHLCCFLNGAVKEEPLCVFDKCLCTKKVNIKQTGSSPSTGGQGTPSVRTDRDVSFVEANSSVEIQR